MALKEQVANVYGVGLGSVGSYQVSGVPHISSPTINDRDETSISFPKVTKDITINKTSAGGELRVHYLSKGTQKQALQFTDLNSDSIVDNWFSFMLSKPEQASWTMSIWYKAVPPTALNSAFLLFRAPGGGGTGTQTAKITFQPNGNIVLSTSYKSYNPSNPTGFGHHTMNTSPIDPSEYYHDGYNNYVLSVGPNLIKHYINGSDHGQSGNVLVDGLESINEVRFPRENFARPTHLAQITIWDKDLSDSEVSELYNSGKYRDPRDHSASDDLSTFLAFDQSLSPADNDTAVYDRVGSRNGTVSVVPGQSDSIQYVDGPGDFLTGSNVIGGHHYISLTDARPTTTLNCKCKEIYLSASGSTQTANIMANLTEIDSSRMYALTGSGIDE